MSLLLTIVAPVFGVVGLGWLAAGSRAFDEAAARGLSIFVFRFALPVALLRTMAAADLSSTAPLSFLGAYYTGTALMLLPALLLGRGGQDRRALQGFACAYSNTVLLGIPLVDAAFGPEGSVALVLLIAFHSPVVFTLVTVLIELGRRQPAPDPGRPGRWRTLPLGLARALTGNLILMAVLAGLAINAAGLALPGPVDRAAELLGRAALPGALFAMGASLRRYRVAGAIAPALTLVAAKLVLHPLLMAALVLGLLDMPPLLASVAILAASLPTGINVYLFATRYETAEAESATAILLSTVLATVTVSITLHLLGVGG